MEDRSCNCRCLLSDPKAHWEFHTETCPVWFDGAEKEAKGEVRDRFNKALAALKKLKALEPNPIIPKDDDNQDIPDAFGCFVSCPQCKGSILEHLEDLKSAWKFKCIPCDHEFIYIDDLVDITSETPSNRSTDNIITLLRGHRWVNKFDNRLNHGGIAVTPQGRKADAIIYDEPVSVDLWSEFAGHTKSTIDDYETDKERIEHILMGAAKKLVNSTVRQLVLLSLQAAIRHLDNPQKAQGIGPLINHLETMGGMDD